MEGLKENIVLEFILDYLKENDLESTENIKRSSISKPHSEPNETEIHIPIEGNGLNKKLKKGIQNLKTSRPLALSDKSGIFTKYVFNEYSIEQGFLKFSSTEKQLQNLIDLLKQHS